MGLADTGRRLSFGTGAVREPATGKGRCDLIPTDALLALARHYEAGAAKYPDATGGRNWEKGQPMSRLYDSAMRHLWQWADGDESEDHLIAALWNVVGLVTIRARVAAGRLPGKLLDLPARTRKENPIP